MKTTILPDGSGFSTGVVMSKEEAMRLPPCERPICFRLSEKMYMATWEAIAESMSIVSPKGFDVPHSERASKVCVGLLFKIANEKEEAVEEALINQVQLMHRNEMACIESDSIVGSCNCNVKSPEVKFHKAGCKYRLIVERGQALSIARDIKKERDELDELRHQLIKERDHLRDRLFDANCMAAAVLVVAILSVGIIIYLR